MATNLRRDPKHVARGRLIADAREQEGWSQAELADRLGVHWTTISRWENGRTGIGDSDLNREVIRVLHLSEEEMTDAPELTLDERLDRIDERLEQVAALVSQLTAVRLTPARPAEPSF